MLSFCGIFLETYFFNQFKQNEWSFIVYVQKADKLNDVHVLAFSMQSMMQTACSPTSYA